jgi:hypothetical protein
MSNLRNPNTSKRVRNSVIILIAALVVFSSVAIVQSNLLQWPLAAELQSLKGNQNSGQSNNSTSRTNSDSSIFVWAQAFIPISQSRNSSSSSMIFGKVPISGAAIKLFENATVSGVSPSSPRGRLNLKGVLVSSNSTNPLGQVRFVVPPGRYLVSMSSQYGNFSFNVLTQVHNTTELDILVNESSYAASYFEIQNQASPGMLLPWESTFLRINSNPLPTVSTNETVYLVFSFLNSSTTPCCSFGNLTLFSPQTVRSIVIGAFESPSQGTLWMQIQTNLILTNINNISGISVIVASTDYTIKEYPMPTQTTVNATSSNSA